MGSEKSKIDLFCVRVYIFLLSGASIRRSPALDLFEQHQGTHILQVRCENLLAFYTFNDENTFSPWMALL